jgi:hypothetical protein
MSRKKFDFLELVIIHIENVKRRSSIVSNTFDVFNATPPHQCSESPWKPTLRVVESSFSGRSTRSTVRRDFQTLACTPFSPAKHFEILPVVGFYVKLSLGGRM